MNRNLQTNVLSVPVTFECNVCYKEFQTARALEQYQRDTEHYECDDCGKTFRTARALEQHQEATGHENTQY